MHGLQYLQHSGSVVVAHGPSSLACGIFPGQGLKLCPLSWLTGIEAVSLVLADGFLSTLPPGKSSIGKYFIACLLEIIYYKSLY